MPRDWPDVKLNSIFIFTNSGRHFVQWFQLLARYQIEFLNKVIEMLIASIDVRLLKNICIYQFNFFLLVFPSTYSPNGYNPVEMMNIDVDKDAKQAC